MNVSKNFKMAAHSIGVGMFRILLGGRGEGGPRFRILGAKGGGKFAAGT